MEPADLLPLVDSPEIGDDDTLYRRVHWERLGGRDSVAADGTVRINGNCFSDYSSADAADAGFAGPCMSVGVDSILREHGFGPEKMVEKFPGYGVISIGVRDLRQLVRIDGTPCRQGIMLAPTATEPWHAVVFDLTLKARNKGVRRQIAEVAQWSVNLPQTGDGSSPI